MKFRVFRFKKVKSTNDTACRIIKNLDVNYGMVISEIQNNGRGQHGKRWISYKGNLFTSFFYNLGNLNISFKKTTHLNCLLVKKLLGIYYKGKITFKKPNDLLIDKKKIAGILIETSVSNNTVTQFIIGIGVNIKSRPNDLKYSSTSLFENGLRVKAHKLFFSIIKRLYYYIENYKNIEFLYLSKKLSDRFFNKKSLINVCNGNYKNEGLFSKIGCMGELIIKNKNKNLTITYGEII